MSADWTTVFPRIRSGFPAVIARTPQPRSSDASSTVSPASRCDQGSGFSSKVPEPTSAPPAVQVAPQSWRRNPEDMGWFTGQLDRIFAEPESSHTLEATMPCCGASVSMNDLLYDPGAGFASWSVSVRGARDAVGDRDRALVEAALGHGVRVVESRI